MKGFNTYILEAKKPRPSGWTRTKKNTRKVNNTYLAGDVYDFHSGTYQQEDTYVDSDYEGFIFDKEGNEYKVFGYSKTGDAGRIVGGSTSYRVIITGNDLKINLSGYCAVFSTPHGANIIPAISRGYYLEDYLAKNEDAIEYSQRKDEKIQALIEKGDKEATSFEDDKETNKKNKELAFAQRYVEFGNMTFEKAKQDSKISIRLNYQNRKENEGQEQQVTDALLDIVTNLLEGAFNLPMSEIYGLRISIRTNKPDKYNVNPAIDVKKKNLVFIESEYRGLNKGYKKKILDTPVELSIAPIIECWYDNTSDKIKEYISIVLKNFEKKEKKTRSTWIKVTADNYYAEYDKNYWSKRKYTRKEAHELAVAAWDSMMRKYQPGKNVLMYIDTETLGEYVNEIKAKHSVTADTPDTSVNDLPEIEVVNKPVEAPKKERGKETVMSKGAKAAAYDKMKAWHEGTRKQNVGAMSDAKLKMNYAVCKELGFDKEVDILKAEADKRELTLESKLTMKEYAELISE